MHINIAFGKNQNQFLNKVFPLILLRNKKEFTFSLQKFKKTNDFREISIFKSKSGHEKCAHNKSKTKKLYFVGKYTDFVMFYYLKLIFNNYMFS